LLARFVAYIWAIPSKPIELPPRVAKAFVSDMRAFFAAPNTLKQNEIAVRQLHALKAALPRQAPTCRREADVPRYEGSRLNKTAAGAGPAAVSPDSLVELEAANRWFAEHDPEGVAFEYPVRT
jgi:hypothetical protein